MEDCKIAVLDVDKEWGDKWGAGKCDLSDPKTWPFAAPGKGIDGLSALPAEHFQYSMEHWIAQVRAVGCGLSAGLSRGLRAEQVVAGGAGAGAGQAGCEAATSCRASTCAGHAWYR